MPFSGPSSYHSNSTGLTEPGSMGYKVYVVLNTSNEAGSNAVTVVRP